MEPARNGPVGTLLILILWAPLATGQEEPEYAQFRRQAATLWEFVTAGTGPEPFDSIVGGHRGHFHRFFLETEIELVRAPEPDSPRLRARMVQLAEIARDRFGVDFYLHRAESVLGALRGGPALEPAWNWRGDPPPGDAVLEALAAVERARAAIEQVPPGPMPAPMRACVRRLAAAGCPDGALDGLVSLATWHLLRGNFTIGEQALEAAKEMDRAAGAGRTSEIELLRGHLALKREDFEEARDRFRAAVAAATGDRRRLMAQAHHAQALAYLLDHGRACEESLVVMRGLDALSAASRAIALVALVEVELRAARFAEALERNRLAARAAGEAESEAARKRLGLLVRRQRGYIHMATGRFAEAARDFEAGLAEAHGQGDLFEEIYHLRYLAELAFRQGREGETLDHGLRMLEAARAARTDKEVFLALRYLGKVHLRWGLLEDGALYLREGLDVASRVGLPHWRREILRDLLEVMERQGLRAEADRYERELRQDLPEARGGAGGVSDALLLARLARGRGDPEQAARDLDAALDQLDALADAGADPAVVWLRGAAAIEAAEQAGDTGEALACLEEAESWAQRVKDPLLEAGALTRKALHLGASGRLEESRDALARAFELGSAGLRFTGSLPLRAGFFEESRDVMGRLARVTLELERQGRQPDEAAFVLRLAEKQRDRRFRAEWSAYGAAATSPRLRELKGQLEEVLRIFETSDRLDASGRRAIYQRLIELRDEYNRLTNEAWQERPHVDPDQLDVERLRARLGEALMVAFLLGEEDAFVIAVGRSEGVKVIRLATPVRALEGRVRYLDTFVQRLRPGHESDFARPAHALFRDLLEPVVAAGWLPAGRPLVIVPDRALERLPFHALVTEPPPPSAAGGGFRDIPYLVLRNPVRYLTAAADLLAAPAAEAVEPRFLGVAPAAELTGLGGAADEVKRIGAQLPPGRAALALGADAGKSRLLARSDLREQTILHFATHGRASALDYSFSGLVLGAADERGGDGVLRGYEVKAAGLAPALVVLSACSSGRDMADPGVTGVGWGRVFLEAGAAAVVLSNWRVDDRITVGFMETFYDRLLAGVPADRALAEAARARIRGAAAAGAANPRHWAPFVLVGQAVRFRSRPD
ncbi:MAG: CHAT domain-containing protein [Planctomycetes bacterium]|nr:CHAT domain-containing protein [Planctomycetota bacterium]